MQGKDGVELFSPMPSNNQKPLIILKYVNVLFYFKCLKFTLLKQILIVEFLKSHLVLQLPKIINQLCAPLKIFLLLDKC